MREKSSVLIIKNVESFQYQLVRLCSEEVFRLFNVNRQETFYHFMDWVIGHILNTQYGMRVFKHQRIDEYLCIYSEHALDINNYFAACINRYDLQILNGCDVGMLQIGENLFITRLTIRRYTETIL